MYNYTGIRYLCWGCIDDSYAFNMGVLLALRRSYQNNGCVQFEHGYVLVYSSMFDVIFVFVRMVRPCLEFVH